MREAVSFFVARISNLPYRRFVTCGRCNLLRRPADWKSAIQQIGNLRYAAASAAHATAFLCIITWFILALRSSAVVVGFDAFSYPDGAINGRSGGAGWNRAGGLTSWSGGGSLPSVSGNVLYTGNNNGAVRVYGGDETASAFQSTGIAFIKVTMSIGSSVPSYAGMSSLDYGTERVCFGRLTNNTFGISEPGYGLALTGVTPAPNTRYTLIAVLDFSNQKLSLFINPTNFGLLQCQRRVEQRGPDQGLSNPVELVHARSLAVLRQRGQCRLGQSHRGHLAGRRGARADRLRAFRRRCHPG